MGTRRRYIAISVIIVAEYLAAAAALVGVVWLQATAPPRSDCGVDSCAFDGIGLLLLAIFGLAVLAVGLLIALVIGVVRERRAVLRAAPPRPSGEGNHVAMHATIAAGWGVLLALPVACLLGVLAALVPRVVK
jgi:hypothetical protein